MPTSGAITIGVSGMDAYSQGLQIISNNVANLNTLGYKAETVQFSDIVDSGNGGLGYGAQQFSGDGVVSQAPRTDFGQGTLSQTGNALDLAMQGDGFIVLQSNGTTYYTRTGSFSVDQNGYISLPGQAAGSSYHLTILNSSNQPTPVNVSAYATNPPAATTTVTLGDNLSSTATSASVSNITVYDSAGTAHTWTLTLAPTPASGSSGSSSSPGSWTATVTDSTGATIGTGTIAFNGSVPSSTADSFTLTNQPTDGAAKLSVTFDFSNVTSYDAGSTSSLAATKVDGAAVGTLSTVTVNSSGDVLLTYSNNQTKNLGAVAVADFRDNQDLTSIGNGLYQNTKGALSEFVASGTGNAGTVVSGQLETSNVNLTQEFGQLILIQRGYQASSEVVSVSNDMIQQLFRIRGQGG